MVEYAKSFYQRTELVIRCLPYVSEETCFALKGGTAINFFIHEMPRLSVDIDLAYLPISPRNEAIEEINQALNRIAKNIQRALPNIKISMDRDLTDGTVSKLLIQSSNAIIKVETNSVFRGSVFPSEEKVLCSFAQTAFESYVKMNVLPESDLYAGKLCAMVARQHPRDLFDVKILLDTIGLTDDLRQAFVIYLCGDRRPLDELLSPRIKNQEVLFEKEFIGMLREKITYLELSRVSSQFFQLLKEKITNDEKQFLLSFASGEPEWKLINILHASQLPALQWKVLNIKKMNAEKRKALISKLQACLE